MGFFDWFMRDNRSSISYRGLEPNDYEKVRFTLSKYQVAGTHGGVKGTSSYGYDRSRVDGAMIKRKRGN